MDNHGPTPPGSDSKQAFIDAIVATIGDARGSRRDNSQAIAQAFAEAAIFIFGYQVTAEIGEAITQIANDTYPFIAGASE